MLTGRRGGGGVCVLLEGGSLYICVRQCGGWGGGWVCVFVCQINYLNPATIKAEICYQRPPLEPHVSALLPQYAPRSLPLPGLSVEPDKDHKLWILNTHPSRTKANSARLWPRDSHAHTECLHHSSVWIFWQRFLLMKNGDKMLLRSHGTFDFHDVVVMWGLRVWSVYNGGLPLLHIWGVAGESIMVVHDGISVSALISVFTPCAPLSFPLSHYSSLDSHSLPLSILPHSLFSFPAYFFYCRSKLPISHLRKQPPVCAYVCTLMSGLSFE